MYCAPILDSFAFTGFTMATPKPGPLPSIRDKGVALGIPRPPILRLLFHVASGAIDPNRLSNGSHRGEPFSLTA